MTKIETVKYGSSNIAISLALIGSGVAFWTAVIAPFVS